MRGKRSVAEQLNAFVLHIGLYAKNILLTYYADEDPTRGLLLQSPTAFFPSRVRPSVLLTRHNHMLFVLQSLPTLHVCPRAPRLARFLYDNSQHEVSCQNVLGRGNQDCST